MIDAHVHMVGTGLHGSGCRLNLRKWHDRLTARIMLRSLGLPYSAMRGDLETVYLARIRQLRIEAGLSHLVILAQDFPHSDSGEQLPAKAKLFVPNAYVLEIARRYRDCLAGVSIHPARPDALDELEACIQQGAALVKILPNVQNIDCSNRKYIRFWERMGEAGLPLLAHTGGELSLPVLNKHYADPRTLGLPLECGVNVIAAHCGTSSLYFDEDFTNVLLNLFARYPNLYADNSGMNTPFRCRHLPRLSTGAFAERMIHGSDLPIPISAVWLWLRGKLSIRQFNQLAKISNPLKQDIAIKRALGFPEDTFSRLYGLLSAKVLKRMRDLEESDHEEHR